MSEVCYLRNLFPSDAFKEVTFGGTTVRALIPRELGPDGKSTSVIKHPAVQQLLECQESAFEALEKGYLRSIIFGVYSGEEKPEDRKLIESYVYTFNYGEDRDVHVTLQHDKEAFTMPRLRDEVVQMIRSLISLCHTMKPAPEVRYVSMKLFYYDHTPEEYQPAHFSDATYEEHQFFDTPPIKHNLGSCKSRHHTLTLKVAFQEAEEGAGAGAGSSASAEEEEELDDMNGIAALQKASMDKPTAAAATSSSRAPLSRREEEEGEGEGEEEAARPAAKPLSKPAAPTKATPAPAAKPATPAAPTKQPQPQPRAGVPAKKGLKVPAGVDPATFAAARLLVARTRKCTLKHVVESMAQQPVPGGDGTEFFSLSGEQARKIIRQLEEEGLAKPDESSRFKFRVDSKKAAAIVAEEEGDDEEPPHHSSSGAAKQADTSFVLDDAAAAAAAPESSSASGSGSGSASASGGYSDAQKLYAKAMMVVFSAPKRKGITVNDLAEEMMVSKRRMAPQLLTYMERIGLLGAVSSTGLPAVVGRPLLFTPLAEAQYAKARALLLSIGEIESAEEYVYAGTALPVKLPQFQPLQAAPASRPLVPPTAGTTSSGGNGGNAGKKRSVADLYSEDDDLGAVPAAAASTAAKKAKIATMPPAASAPALASLVTPSAKTARPHTAGATSSGSSSTGKQAQATTPSAPSTIKKAPAPAAPPASIWMRSTATKQQPVVGSAAPSDAGMDASWLQ